MKVITPKFGKKTPDDLPMILRELADAADRGEIECFVAAYIQGNEYEFHISASITDSIVLATMLQDINIRRMRNE